MNTLRKSFNPEDDFVVVKPMIVTNQKVEVDNTRLFDKKLVTGRLLRQLYEQKYLEVADPSKLTEDPSPKKLKRAARFTDATGTP